MSANDKPHRQQRHKEQAKAVMRAVPTIEAIGLSKKHGSFNALDSLSVNRGTK